MQFLLKLCIFACLAAAAIAFSCYGCESVYDANCGEDFDAENHFKRDCEYVKPPRYLQSELADEELNATACMKRIYKENGLQRIVRSCFFGDVNDTEIGCQLDPSLEGVESLSCHVCNDVNFCNQASSLSTWPAQLALIGFVLMAKMLK